MTLNKLFKILLSLALATAAQAEIVDRIVATVDGEPITAYELEQFRRQSSQDPSLAKLSPSDLLEAMITDKIIDQEAQQKGIVVRKDDIDRYVESVKERNRINDAQLAEALKAQGMTIEAYRLQVRREIQRQQLINREIRGKVNIPPEEVERYYSAHRDEYAAAGGYEVAHIVFVLPANPTNAQLVAVRAKADEIAEQLSNGADFAATATRVSEDPGSAKDGGMLGWFKEGELSDSLEKEALKLKAGEVSKPVRGPKGLHILKVTNRRDDDSTKPQAETSEQIKEKLYAEALDVRFREWLQTDLRKNHHVEILP